MTTHLSFVSWECFQSWFRVQEHELTLPDLTTGSVISQLHAKETRRRMEQGNEMKDQIIHSEEGIGGEES